MDILSGNIICNHLVQVPSFNLFLRNVNTAFHHKWYYYEGKKLLKKKKLFDDLKLQLEL